MYKNLFIVTRCAWHFVRLTKNMLKRCRVLCSYGVGKTVHPASIYETYAVIP